MTLYSAVLSSGERPSPPLMLRRLGSESSYLEYTQTRLDSEELSLSTRQDSLEFRDPAEAIMDYTMAEYIYNASLNMGSRLLQNSLFDYMR